MTSSKVAWIGIVVLVILGAWYWMSKPAATPTGAVGEQASTTHMNTTQTAVTVVHDAKLGDYLVAANGMTLYRNTKDADRVSNCTGTCAVNWPPYVPANAAPLKGGAGVMGSLSAFPRSDTHSAQITYNGTPLYFYKNDTKTGDTSGQGVGGVWFVVKP